MSSRIGGRSREARITLVILAAKLGCAGEAQALPTRHDVYDHVFVKSPQPVMLQSDVEVAIYFSRSARSTKNLGTFICVKL